MQSRPCALDGRAAGKTHGRIVPQEDEAMNALLLDLRLPLSQVLRGARHMTPTLPDAGPQTPAGASGT
jgi:hypothetical protein